jgi:3-deoxy-manno-octulosonate cytidylyltransferase (CMP-KDO synthetase)
MKDILIVIPARLKSSRLPGKMLEDVKGVPLIVATAKNAQLSGYNVLVAADDNKIVEACKLHSIPCDITPLSCQSGTDRLAFLANKFDWSNKVILNVQGDEPILEQEIMKKVVETLIKQDTDMSTAGVPLKSLEEWHNPNCVKLVTSNNKALYFSRAAVPFNRDNPNVIPKELVYRHLGIYAYTSEALKKWDKLATSKIEDIEKLEQWRALENGWSMSAYVTEETNSIAVDTYEDLKRLRDYLN